ncbi:tripartite tricarboxylate transporter TctB family protein [Thermodesulfobacteriota bacterium]
MYILGSGFFFFGLSLFVLWESLRLGLGTLMKPGSGFFSFCAGVILSVLSLVVIYRGWGVRESLTAHSRRVILVLLSLFVYSLVLNTLGFVVSTFFLVGILFQIGESRRWWTLLIMSVLVTSLAYLIFGVLLNVYFPRGFVGI